MTRPAQPSLPLPPPRPAAVAARVPARRVEAEAFEFVAGAECEPDPSYVPPEWLKLPGIDD